MLVLLAAVNYFSFNHYARADFSRSQKFVLSEQTRRVLRELKKPVRVIVFFSPTVLSPETALFSDVQNLLKELIFSGRNKIEVEYVDPTRNLSRARELQEQYKFSVSENVLILDYDGRSRFVLVSDMADFDMSPVESGDPPRLLAFKGEQALTNGMIALLSPERLKVYFLQGHGEPAVGERTPLSVFKGLHHRAERHPSSPVLPFAALLSLRLRDPGDLVSAIRRGRARSDDPGEILEREGPSAHSSRPQGENCPARRISQSDRRGPLGQPGPGTVRLPFATGILRDVTAEFLLPTTPSPNGWRHQHPLPGQRSP